MPNAEGGVIGPGPSLPDPAHLTCIYRFDIDNLDAPRVLARGETCHRDARCPGQLLDRKLSGARTTASTAC